MKSETQTGAVEWLEREGLPRLALAVDRSEREYTGPELRPHFLLSQYGLRGSGIVAFVGPCHVRTDHLVDWEDRIEQDFIRAKKMIHFLGEFFAFTPREGVLLQRLVMSIVCDEIRARLRNGTGILRKGDDLYLFPSESGGINTTLWRKLSVSIVAPSGSSQLLHIGLNCDPEGAPVAAIGLNELQIEPFELIHAVFSRVSAEWNGVEWACTKVRAVV